MSTRRKTRRITAVLLTLCMVCTLLPTTAFATGADTGKAIQLVDSGTAANISGGQGSNIYFGTYQQSSNGSGGYNSDPIKWRVLSNADGKLFLLSDQNLDVLKYHENNKSVTWEKSTMRSWLNGYGAEENTGNDSGKDYTNNNFIDTAFSDKEQGVIADTTVVNNDNPFYHTEGGNDTTDKIFLLSIDEVRNSNYFADDNSREGTNTAYVADGGKIHGDMSGVGRSDQWWLRSPGEGGDIAACVGGHGEVATSGYTVYYDFIAVRPAFNLNLDSVLFTSAAVGGKSSGAVGADALKAVADNAAGTEWKLTLKDDTRSIFTASLHTSSSATVAAGGSVVVEYYNAKTGSNEYISAMLVDGSGKVLYYGNIVKDSASGRTHITIPADLAAGNYTLKIFNEQLNGDKKTDYSSEFKDIDITVTAGGGTTTPTQYNVRINPTTNGTVTADKAQAAEGELVKLTATLAPGYELDSLQVIYGMGAEVALNADYSFTMPNEDVVVNATFKVKATTYTVTFDANGHGTAPAALTGVASGDTISEPTEPCTSGYTFGGWYKEASCTNAWNFGTDTVTDNITLYAKWTKKSSGGGDSVTTKYTLTFDTNGGGKIDSISRKSGTSVDLASYKPTKDGYTFDGWYADAKLNNKITSVKLTKDTTVYAKWTKNAEPAPTPGTGLPFTDVKSGDWFYDDVVYAFENSLMKGTSETTFSPNMTTTRGMIVTVLYRQAGSPAVSGDCPFADVKSGMYYEAPIAWAVANGIANGYSADKFGADDPITREQMAAILYRYAQYKGVDVSAAADLGQFKDAEKVSDWAKDAIAWTVQEGIFNGVGDNLLSPGTQATRAQIATILHRFCENIAK